jgi:transcriptional regulator with XRE-family HTH domain
MLEAGKIIRSLRTEKGLTLRELERKSGVYRGSISNIEHERYGVSLYCFECLLESMGYELQVVPKQ